MAAPQMYQPVLLPGLLLGGLAHGHLPHSCRPLPLFPDSEVLPGHAGTVLQAPLPSD